MTETETSRQLVLDYFRAMRADDHAGLAQVLAEDVEWVPPDSSPLEGRPFIGREVVVAAMDREGSKYFDLTTGRPGAFKIVAEGDTVVVLYSFACTTQAGRDYSNDYVFVFTCADDQIVRIDEHTDTLRFHRLVMES